MPDLQSLSFSVACEDGAGVVILTLNNAQGSSYTFELFDAGGIVNTIAVFSANHTFNNVPDGAFNARAINNDTSTVEAETTEFPIEVACEPPPPPPALDITALVTCDAEPGTGSAAGYILNARVESGYTYELQLQLPDNTVVGTGGVGVQVDNISFPGIATGEYKFKVIEYLGGSAGRTYEEAFTVDCGTEPPPTCDLAVEPAVITGNAILNQVIVTATSSYGPIKYSRDNWATESDSGEFEDFPEGHHRIDVRDELGCTAFVEFDIEPMLPVAIYFSRNPIWFTVPGLTLGQEVELQLWVESEHYAEDYKRILTRRRPALVNGSCSFDLDSILDTLVSAKPETPDLAATQAEFCRLCIRNYYLTWALIDPVTSQPGRFTASDIFTVVRGGVPQEMLPETDFFGAHLDQTKQFLTWTDSSRSVVLGQREFLYFLNRDPDLASLKIRRRIFTPVAQAGTDADEVLALPAGQRKYRLIRIPALAPAPNSATRLTLQVLNATDNPLSQTRSYKFVEGPIDGPRFYLFENSLGGFDTMRANGDTDLSLDAKDTLAERVATPVQDLVDGQIFVASHEVSRKFKQSTGLLRPADFAELQEFIYARARYEIRASKLLPIILSKRGYTFQPGIRKPVGYSFEYDYAFQPIVYAPA